MRIVQKKIQAIKVHKYKDALNWKSGIRNDMVICLTYDDATHLCRKNRKEILLNG